MSIPISDHQYSEEHREQEVCQIKCKPADGNYYGECPHTGKKPVNETEWWRRNGALISTPASSRR